MSRRKPAEKRAIVPDPQYESVELARFINMIMWNGKKSVAERIVYDALERATKKKKMKPLDLFTRVIDDLRPVVEVKSRRVGGATYSVPVEIRSARRTTLAMRWLIQAARGRKNQEMDKSLASEFLDVLDERGAAIKKKQDVHKMAEASRAFSHLRF